MIAALKGMLIEKREQTVTIDVHGVGYRVFLIPTVLQEAKEQSEVMLYVHTHVREDALALYGFFTADELRMFEQLISVSGVGPKSGLMILSLASPKEIRHAITRDDVSVLTKVSGIGKKTAERIVLELRGKIEEKYAEDSGVTAEDAEVIDALVGLGYRLKEARDAVRALKDKGADTGRKIKEALAMLGGNRT